jgi:hypothetical protein
MMLSMKPILFQKGKNGIFKVSIREFSHVFGIGKDEDEATENFLGRFEDWAQSDLPRFKIWFDRIRPELQALTNDSQASDFEDVEQDF